MGISHGYEPDFLVKLADDRTLILEIKGEEPDKDRAKHAAARRWVSAVNNWGNWAGGPSTCAGIHSYWEGNWPTSWRIQMGRDSFAAAGCPDRRAREAITVLNYRRGAFPASCSTETQWCYNGRETAEGGLTWW